MLEVSEYWVLFKHPHPEVARFILEQDGPHLVPSRLNHEERMPIMKEATKLYYQAKALKKSAYWLVSESYYEKLHELFTNPQWEMDKEVSGPARLMDLPVYIDDGAKLDTDERIRLVDFVPKFIDIKSPLL